MKKTIFSCLVFLFSIITYSNAQDNPYFAQGQYDLNIGIGLGSNLGGGLPISASLDVGINDQISIGGYLGFVSVKVPGFSTIGDFRYNYLIFGGRGAYHYQLIDNMDTYVGAMLGFNRASVGGGGGTLGAGIGGFTWSGFVGGRYVFSDAIAGFAELGYGISYLTVGVNYAW